MQIHQPQKGIMKKFTIEEDGTVRVTSNFECHPVTVEAPNTAAATKAFMQILLHRARNGPALHFRGGAWAIVQGNDELKFSAEVGVVGSSISMMSTGGESHAEAAESCFGYYGTYEHMTARLENPPSIGELLQHRAAMLLEARTRMIREATTDDIDSAWLELQAPSPVYPGLQHPTYTTMHWRMEVGAENTRLSYTEWVVERIAESRKEPTNQDESE
jgi:hypothetical protein